MGIDRPERSDADAGERAELGPLRLEELDCQANGFLRSRGRNANLGADIVEVPPVTAVARPEVLIVATDVVADAQVTWLVRV